MHGMVILSGHPSAEPVNYSFRGNPYLITRLYSLKYKVTCVVHMSHAWISRYVFLNGTASIRTSILMTYMILLGFCQIGLPPRFCPNLCNSHKIYPLRSNQPPKLKYIHSPMFTPTNSIYLPACDPPSFFSGIA